MGIFEHLNSFCVNKLIQSIRKHENQSSEVDREKTETRRNSCKLIISVKIVFQSVIQHVCLPYGIPFGSVHII